MNKIIIICGPTCSGKTKFSIKLASIIGGEIISADSMQVYRYMDIGTAKPSIEERSTVLHYMLDIIDPDEYFNAYKYSKLAKEVIKHIIKSKKIPIVVGGSGLYINFLINGLFKDSFESMESRSEFYKRAKKYGIEKLYYKLLEIDRNFVKKIHKNDLFRIVRALELFKNTGRSVSSIKREFGSNCCFFDYIIFGLKWDRLKLYNRINNRVDMMISRGFVDEVRSLLNDGFLSSLRSMNSLGYRHIVDFLINNSFWNKTLKDLKRDHRRYAKRQLNWFTSIETINWVSVNDIKTASDLVKHFLGS